MPWSWLRIFSSNFFLIFSDTKQLLKQEVEERTGNIALLTDADNQLTFQIQNLFDEFQNLKTTIESMTSTIEGLNNEVNVLKNSLYDNALRFHVENRTQPGDVITYESKLIDTHNAMNIETGTFTAPFSGSYGFVLYARFQCFNDGNSQLFYDVVGSNIFLYYL